MRFPLEMLTLANENDSTLPNEMDNNRLENHEQIFAMLHRRLNLDNMIVRLNKNIQQIINFECGELLS